MFKINPNGMIIEYSKIFHKLERNHGLLYTVTKLKQLHGVSQRYSCGQNFERLPFTKVINSSSKLPLLLKVFKPFLDGDANDRRAALTVLSIYRLINSVNNTIDYSQIEAPRSIERDFNDLDVNSNNSYLHRKVHSLPYDRVNHQLLRSWKHCVNTMFKPAYIEGNLKQISGSCLHVSAKNGPNGPCLSSISLDFLGILNDGVINDVIQVGVLTGNNDLLGVLKLHMDEPPVFDPPLEKAPLSAKLSLKQEAGGKNRVFAIGDYFTQSALKGLHDYLFRIIKGLPEDGTSSHNRVSQIVKEWSSNAENRIHSVDLTGATNFIDCEVLGEIIASGFGKEFASHWVNLMVNRPFTDIEGNQRRYTVGQPMGFYSSWAMLAIWNHLMVRTCRHALKLSPDRDNPQFVIIGDDVAILGDDVAHMYLRLSELMGVPISTMKGFSPLTKSRYGNLITNRSTMSSVEIAKRVFVDGIELSGISPVEITGGLSKSYSFPALLLSCSERGLLSDFTKEDLHILARETGSPRSTKDLTLFPIAPALNWVTVVTGEWVYVENLGYESFWHGLKWETINNLYNTCIIRRLNSALRKINIMLSSYSNTREDSVFTCKKLKFQSSAYFFTMMQICNNLSAAAERARNRFQIGSDEDPDLPVNLPEQIAKSRYVRRRIGTLNPIFEIESLVAKGQEGFNFENSNTKTDRLMMSIMLDIKALDAQMANISLSHLKIRNKELHTAD